MELKPTDKELEILQVLWDKGGCTVKDVQDALGGLDTNGYTTILKMLQIMHEKGLITRQKEGKQHRYEAAVSREKTQGQVLDRVIETVFMGSASSLVLQLLGQGKTSEAELNAIRKYLDSIKPD